MKFFKNFDEFNNWNYDNCQAKLVDVFTGSGNNFVVLDRISGSLYCNPKYFETDIDAKIYAKDNFILQRVVIMLFDMEQYIASYKHIIGCEVCHQVGTSLYTNIITSVSDCNPFGTSGVVHDARGLYENQLPFNLLKFYLDDETLGAYEEYMKLHYPEYEQIWRKHL